MILPIFAFGYPVLKKKAKVIAPDHEKLAELISNMWETMYNAKGIGLAGPQVGRSIRIFIADTVQLEDEEKDLVGFKKVFINAEIISEEGKDFDFEEGCLSIPDIRGNVTRKPKVTIKYLDKDFKEHTETYDGINARVIQHEYDHIDGKLFTEYLPPLRKRLIKRKLDNIAKGKVSVDYRMKFFKS